MCSVPGCGKKAEGRLWLTIPDFHPLNIPLCVRCHEALLNARNAVIQADAYKATTHTADLATGHPDPIRSTYSRAEIGAKAREFMEREYGKSFDASDRDAWYAKYGLLISFIHDHFPDDAVPKR